MNLIYFSVYFLLAFLQYLKHLLNAKELFSINYPFISVDVTCRQLGFKSGVPLCCAPYGYIKSHGTMETIKCRGDEKRLTNCPHELPYGSMCSMDYAAAACFNGSLPKRKL